MFAIGQTARQIDASQSKLASGLRVASALDDPQNFFTARSLSQESSSLSSVLDKIGQSVRAIQMAENGLQGIDAIVDRARNIVQDAAETFKNNEADLSDVILADDPVLHYKFDETSGNRAINYGSGGTAINGTYQGATRNNDAIHHGINNKTASFDGVNDAVAIPNNALINTSAAGYAERTVELTFRAEEIGGRQVLFEEGGTGNSASIYLDDDQIYFVARDAGDFGPFNISAKVEEGQTYHAAFVLDSNSGTFTGYLDGEAVGEGSVNRSLSRHGGAVAIGRNSGGTFFHDGANGGNGEYFNGNIGDFALYNSALTQEDLQTRFDVTQLEDARNYEQQVSEVLSQIDPISEDTSYRGINLLEGDNVTSYFNVGGDSNLVTEGRELTASGLGFASFDFQTAKSFNNTVRAVDKVFDQIETFSSSLVSDLNLIQTRQDYTQNTINTLESGSDDLTLLDQTEEGANLLALQARQSIQTQALSLSTQGSNIGDLLANSSIFN